MAYLYFCCLNRQIAIQLQVREIWVLSSGDGAYGDMWELAVYRHQRASLYYYLERWRNALRIRSQVWQGCIYSPFCTLSLHLSIFPYIRSYFAYLYSSYTWGSINLKNIATQCCCLSTLNPSQNARYPFYLYNIDQSISALSTMTSTFLSQIIKQFQSQLMANSLLLTQRQAREDSRQSLMGELGMNVGLRVVLWGQRGLVVGRMYVLMSRCWKDGQVFLNYCIRINSPPFSSYKQLQSKMFLQPPIYNNCSPLIFTSSFTFSLICTVFLGFRWSALRQNNSAELTSISYFQYIYASQIRYYGFYERNKTLWYISIASQKEPYAERDRALCNLCYLLQSMMRYLELGLKGQLVWGFMGRYLFKCIVYRMGLYYQSQRSCKA